MKNVKKKNRNNRNVVGNYAAALYPKNVASHTPWFLCCFYFTEQKKKCFVS